MNVDANWIDIGSVVTGILYIPFQQIRLRGRRRLLSKATGLDFANGAALFPLLVLTVSVLSSELVKGLMEASKMTLSIAGFFALVSILEEPEAAHPQHRNPRT